jgi:hypothetical protein
MRISLLSGLFLLWAVVVFPPEGNCGALDCILHKVTAEHPGNIVLVVGAGRVLADGFDRAYLYSKPGTCHRGGPDR